MLLIYRDTDFGNAKRLSTCLNIGSQLTRQCEAHIRLLHSLKQSSWLRGWDGDSDDREFQRPMQVRGVQNI